MAQAGAVKLIEDELFDRFWNCDRPGIRSGAFEDIAVVAAAGAGASREADARRAGRTRHSGRIPPVAELVGRPGCTLTEASYVVPPPPAELMNLLGRWETFLHEQSLLPLVQAALMHYPGPGSKSPTYNNVLSPPINSSCRQTILIS